MALRPTTKFIVVTFEGCTLRDGKRAVELVPKAWIENIEEKWFCAYPPEEDYALVSDWVRDEKDADEEWVKFEINIIKQCKSYSKGLKKLEKSFTDAVINSTDTEDQASHTLPTIDIDLVRIINEDEITEELANIPIFQSNEDISQVNSSTSKRTSLESSDEPANKKGKLATKEDLHEMEKRIKKSMNAMKASLQYDIREFCKQVAVNSMVIPGLTAGTTADLPPLPFQTLEDFQTFDQSIQAEKEKKEALIILITKLTLGEDTFQNATSRVLKALLSKAVQLLYSGCGRKINGHGKENFRSTNTYICMKAFLEQKFTIESGKLMSYVSRWFSGAGDREGGKNDRAQKKNAE